jgi:hypothetical protein
MSPAFLANLERSMRAFVALVTKLEAIGDDPEFRHVFTLSTIHGHPYGGPNWEAELSEAQACLREAEALASSPKATDAKVPGSAVSEGPGG